MFPFNQVEEQFNIYANLMNGKPFIGGLFNANQPPQYTYVKPILDQFPAPEALTLLRELGVTYVVVVKASYPNLEGLDSQMAASGLVLLVDLDLHRVYGFSSP